MPLPGEVADIKALTTQEVSFNSDGVEIDAYLARPRQAGAYPGIIVIHEAFGLNDHIRDLARRLANRGFITLAPNLYARAGAPDPTDLPSVLQKMNSIVDAQTVRDLERAAAFLRTQPGANGKVGCIGFCSGGRNTLLFACSSPEVDAAIDCWGGSIMTASGDTKTTQERPVPIIDMVGDLQCPLLAVFGEEDQNPSPEHARELERRAQAAGKDATTRVFANAGHAFLADYRPSYREAAAFELWPQIVAFFEEHLRK